MGIDHFFQIVKSILPRRFSAGLQAQYVLAAIDNDVARMKLLEKLGADANGDVDELIYGPENRMGGGTVLMAAVGAGAFDASLHLAQSADATVISGAYHEEHMWMRALDFLIKCNVQSAEDTKAYLYECLAGVPRKVVAKENEEEKRLRHWKNTDLDIYTPEQRMRIFEALVAHVKKPLDLVTVQTVCLAVQMGRADMIPLLAGIGVEIENQHFVDAAHPLHRPGAALPMMEATLPYVESVNVIGDYDLNAGHNAAAHTDLEAFKWLEARGLEMAPAVKYGTSYAHEVAADFIMGGNREEKVAFAKYLVEQGYPIDVIAGKHRRYTPADIAFLDNGIPAVGLVYLDAGAEARPEYLIGAINARHFNRISDADLLRTVKLLDERGLLNKQNVLKAAFIEVAEWIAANEKNIPSMTPVAAFLVEKGLVLKPKMQSIAHKIVSFQPLNEDDQRTAAITAMKWRSNLMQADI
ncbi:MAG: hypothetical protein PHY92_00875 [Alphaproteobacteria bacterium]|nr:hypothetical protein [Alphaproteobacteria bacterium]